MTRRSRRTVAADVGAGERQRRAAAAVTPITCRVKDRSTPAGRPRRTAVHARELPDTTAVETVVVTVEPAFTVRRSTV